MKKASLKSFTLKLITADMVLNWLLGFAFTFFHLPIERLIATQTLFLPLVWWLIGIGFLAFAAWQVGIVSRQEIKSQELVFAATLALGPVILLTIALLMKFPLYPWARLVLWIGDAYMLLLSGWYIFLSNQLKDRLKRR